MCWFALLVLGRFVEPIRPFWCIHGRGWQPSRSLRKVRFAAIGGEISGEFVSDGIPPIRLGIHIITLEMPFAQYLHFYPSNIRIERIREGSYESPDNPGKIPCCPNDLSWLIGPVGVRSFPNVLERPIVDGTC